MKHKKSPLPFQGQKRNFLKQFNEALNSYPSNGTYVDLFGGSGLLSHTVKQKYPNAKVVYNDFDGFSNRLANIPKTNALLADIRQITEYLPKDERIVGKHRESIINRIRKEKGFVDYITLSASLLFSGKYATDLDTFEKQTFYNCTRLSDYDATGYLKDVQIVTEDYKELFNQYKQIDEVVYLVDPPYLSTDVTAYNKASYWHLTDYLDVVKVLEQGKYFYFTSNKSQILELFEWIEDHTGGRTPFAGAKIDKRTNHINNTAKSSGKYTDIMIYKGWSSNSTY